MEHDVAELAQIAFLGRDLRDTVDLSGLSQLQSVCAEVNQAGRVTDEQATVVRDQLTGAVLPTSSGGALRVQYLSDEGFIMRTAGPNRSSLVGPARRA